MQELLQRDPPLDLPVENEKLVRREICKATGLLPSRFSPANAERTLSRRTEPRDYSSDYFAADGNCFCPTRTAVGARAVTIPSARMSEPIFSYYQSTAERALQIDPVLPSSQQMVELSAALAGDVRWSLMASKFQRGTTPDFLAVGARRVDCARWSVASEPLKKRSLSSKAAPGDIRPLLRLRARSADQPICHVPRIKSFSRSTASASRYEFHRRLPT